MRDRVVWGWCPFSFSSYFPIIFVSLGFHRPCQLQTLNLKTAKKYSFVSRELSVERFSWFQGLKSETPTNLWQSGRSVLATFCHRGKNNSFKEFLLSCRVQIRRRHFKLVRIVPFVQWRWNSLEQLSTVKTQSIKNEAGRKLIITINCCRYRLDTWALKNINLICMTCQLCHVIGRRELLILSLFTFLKSARASSSLLNAHFLAKSTWSNCF